MSFIIHFLHTFCQTRHHLRRSLSMFLFCSPALCVRLHFDFISNFKCFALQSLRHMQSSFSSIYLYTVVERNETNMNEDCFDFSINIFQFVFCFVVFDFVFSHTTTPSAFSFFFSVFFFFFCLQDETYNTTSRSELSFVPSTEDDGKSITCRAENPKVTGLFLETTWKLNVVCK